VTVIARVPCATAQSEQAAADALSLQDPVTVRSLADLGQGARGRIVELCLPRGRRTPPSSPLRPGATVYVAEATGGRWLHVRIDDREYSIPLAAFRARYRLPP
jgi:hypothetical protein